MQFDHARIAGATLHLLEAIVRWHLRRTIAQLEIHAAIQGLIVAEVFGEQPVKRRARGPIERRLRQLPPVSWLVEIRRGGEQQHRRVSRGDRDFVVGDGLRSPFSDHPQAAQEARASRGLAIVRAAPQHQITVRHLGHRGRNAAQPGREAQPPRLVARQAHHQHVRRRTDKHLASEDRITLPIAYRGDSPAHVQFTSIVARCAGGAKCQRQVSERLIRPKRPLSEELFLDERVRFGVPACEQQSTNLGQIFVRPHAVVV